jgi:hypothetical protein
MSSDDHHFRREDRAEHWRRIAAHIEAHPEDLAIALDNIERWEAWGRVHPGPLREWKSRIQAAQRSPEAMEELLAFLAAPNHDAEPLKSCSPFVGMAVTSSTKHRS